MRYRILCCLFTVALVACSDEGNAQFAQTKAAFIVQLNRHASEVRRDDSDLRHATYVSDQITNLVTYLQTVQQPSEFSPRLYHAYFVVDEPSITRAAMHWVDHADQVVGAYTTLDDRELSVIMFSDEFRSRLQQLVGQTFARSIRVPLAIHKNTEDLSNGQTDRLSIVAGESGRFAIGLITKTGSRTQTIPVFFTDEFLEFLREEQADAESDGSEKG